MNNINPIYNINSFYSPTFKQKEVNNSVITNPINSNVSMNGIDALASYNQCRSAAITDKLDIPILSPVNVPENPNEIEGEKTFNNFTGETTVIQKDNNITKSYIYEKNGSYTHEIRDNKGHILFIQSKNITPDGIFTKIIREQPVGSNIKGIQALYRDGNLEHVSRYTIPSKESPVGYSYEDIGYNAVSKTYYVEKCDSNNKTLTQHFDNNLKSISS